MITTALTRIQKAATPDKFDKKFLEETLGMKGGSPATLVPFVKRIGLVSPDGAPSELYKQFRGEGNKSRAMAQAVRTGYREIFARDENAHKLSREELRALVIQITGAGEDARMVDLIISSFHKLKEFADFENGGRLQKPQAVEDEQVQEVEEVNASLRAVLPPVSRFNIGYTINLNLPETTNPAVFNAIFKALKEHLLREQ